MNAWMMGWSFALAMVVGVSAPALAGDADTLVAKDSSGQFAPSVAASWKAGENSVTFVLKQGWQADEVVSVLQDRLAGATIAADGASVTITGIPPAALLEQLASLSLRGNADPLADLAGLGGTVLAMQEPEGGGSIRASKPMDGAPGLTAPEDHDPAERLHAVVLEVRRDNFPNVSLRLRVQRPAQTGPLRQQLRPGKLLEAPVLTMVAAQKDAAGAIHVQNLTGYYLKKGDRVLLHVKSVGDDAWVIDWIDRL